MLFLRYYLWIAPNALCGVALVIAIRKKLHLRFPAFATLLAFNSTVELLLSLACSLLFPQSVYRWWLVLDITAAFVLQVFVLYEIATQIVSSRPALKKLVQPLPRFTAAILVLIATIFAAFIPQTARGHALNIFQTLGFGMNVVAIGLLFGMSLFTRILGISWRGIPAGVALGFGVVAATELAVLPLMAQLGRSSYIPLDVMRMISFHICVVIWLVYLLLPERTPRFHSDVQIQDLEDRTRELQRILRS